MHTFGWDFELKIFTRSANHALDFGFKSLQDGIIKQDNWWNWTRVSRPPHAPTPVVVRCHCYFVYCLFRILFQVVPVYVAEISPEKLRGRMQTFFTTFQAVGVLVRKFN